MYGWRLLVPLSEHRGQLLVGRFVATHEERLALLAARGQRDGFNVPALFAQPVEDGNDGVELQRLTLCVLWDDGRVANDDADGAGNG